MDFHSPRDIDVICEEIEDLTAYLTGLPKSFKSGTTFFSYEKRLLNLERELIRSWCAKFVDVNDELQASWTQEKLARNEFLKASKEMEIELLVLQRNSKSLRARAFIYFGATLITYLLFMYFAFNYLSQPWQSWAPTLFLLFGSAALEFNRVGREAKQLNLEISLVKKRIVSLEKISDDKIKSHAQSLMEQCKLFMLSSDKVNLEMAK